MGEVIYINSGHHRLEFIKGSGNKEIVEYDLWGPFGRCGSNMNMVAAYRSVFKKILMEGRDWISGVDMYVELAMAASRATNSWREYEIELRHATLYKRVSNKKIDVIEGRYIGYEKNANEFIERLFSAKDPCYKKLINFLNLNREI